MSSRPGRRWYAAFLALPIALLMIAALAVGCGGGDATDGNGDDGDTEPQSRLTWPTAYQNARRTGRSAVNGPTDNQPDWTYETGAKSFSWTVLGKDGDILAGLEGKVISVDPASGGLNWEYPVGGDSATTCDMGPDGTVYFSAGNSIHALSPGGDEKWSYDLGNEADGPSVGTDAIYAGSVGGKLVALSPQGEMIWETKVEGDIRSPSIGKDGNLYCGAAPLVLYAFDKDGEKLWEQRPEGELPLYGNLMEWSNTMDYPSIGDDGTIYVGSFPYPGVTSTGQMIQGYAIPTFGKLYAISSQGDLEWSLDRTYQGCTYFNVHSPSIGIDGTLYAGTSHWRVWAIDPGGNLMWEFNLEEVINECPSVFSPSIGKNGLLYAATTSGKMICINPDGTENWRYESGVPWLPDMSRSNNMTPPPIAEDGTLFSLQAEGKIYAWKTGTAQ